MASYISIMQQMFSSSILGPVTNTTIDPGSLSNHTAEGLSGITEMPQDLSSFIALLFSFSALRDWLKLIVIGGFFETCRRLVVSAYRKVVDAFFISASFDQGDASYSAYPLFLVSLPMMYPNIPGWILVWLSKQPSWSKSQAQVHLHRCG
jgi:chaperone BCS1